MKKSLSLLIGGTLLAWALVAVPARYLTNDLAYLHSAAAALLCLVPTALTLAWTRWAFKGLPEQQLLAVMGGTVVRMAFVIGAGMALYHLAPDFNYQRFWLWVIGFYLFTLALEMVLLTQQTSAEQAEKNGPHGVAR